MRADRGEIQSLTELCEESSISPNTTMAAPGLVGARYATPMWSLFLVKFYH